MKILERRFIDFDCPSQFPKRKPQSVHAASVEFLEDDEPYFACFGGIREGTPDVAIYVHHKGKNIIIGAEDDIPRWNPILFNLNEKLYLIEKKGLFCDRWQTQIHDLTNVDFSKGISWKSNIINIPAGLNAAVKTKPIIVNGLIYCGSSVETMWDWTSYVEVYSDLFDYKFRSKPLTVAKKRYTSFCGTQNLTQGIIQPSLWYDGVKMHAFFRSSKGLGYIYHSVCDSDDQLTGQYFNGWSKPKATELENPNSGIDTVFYKDRLFLVYNPNKFVRMPLMVSQLDSNSFAVEDSLEVTKAASVEDGILTGELSYPYMVERDGKLHLVYTYGRTKIEYVVIEI
ncbi:MAG: exo-alpha-sialidase [Methanomassiliicoccales archaeon]|jgi:predicted neuraminidase